MTQSEFNAAVDHMCSRARAKEVQFDELRTETSRLLIAGAECSGALSESRLQLATVQADLIRVRSDRDRRWSTWAVIGVAVGGLVAGGVAGALLIR